MTAKTKENSKVAYIGLGKMGSGMANQLFEHGVTLKVFDISDEAVQPFVDRGIATGSSIQEIAAWADILICSLPGPPQVEEVIIGKEGAIQTLQSGSIVIDMSTAGPAIERKCGEALAEKGIAFIDAPVGKGWIQAADGTLSIMMGGDQELCDSLEWLFSIMGSELFYCGPLGSGQVVKLANNFINTANLAVLTEGYSLAKAGGADLNIFSEVIQLTAANSFHVKNSLIGRAMQNNFEPGFKVSLGRKDIRLAGDLANELGVPIAAGLGAIQSYDKAADLGHEDLDFSALFLNVDPSLKKD